MNIRNLQFFDYNGYNLNFELNDSGYWEGNIYFPKVSVGLYANTTIYVVEKVNDSLVFPTGLGKITFKWDPLNKFVDEFFMFNFDEDYVTQSTTLNYVPNDGPECETLLVNTFDTYEVSLDNTDQTLLPIHIAFCANEKYDATTYNRTLFMYYGKDIVAKIKFYAETVEEDERLNIWNANLGYKITPEDEMIFHRSDINEYKSDYILLNEKRKELMLEGSNIYPYVGSYKAIINAIKFFGYENLNIIEYWKNINPDDVNFGKIYHSSKYSLSNKETLRIGSRNIVLPNKDYKKINSIALVYPINTLTGEYDEWELPKVREAFAYTLEEVLIKLFALKKKLDKEFMPGSSKIIDIIGEGNYFGLHKISTFGVSCNHIDNTHAPKEFPIAIDVAPDSYSYITDNTFFANYVYFKIFGEEYAPFRNQVLSDISNTPLSEIHNEQTYSELLQVLSDTILSQNKKICNYYKDFKRTFVDNKTNYNDDYPYNNDEYNYTKDPYSRFSGKFILINKSLDRLMMENNRWDYDGDNAPSKISWNVEMTKDENQYDDDLRKIGIVKKYEYHDLYSASTYNLDMSVSSDRLKFTDIKNRFCIEHGDISEYNQFFVQLPFIGYYDVTISLEDANNNVIQEKTFTKFLKVEPYNIDLIGFYYDAREIPDKLKYEMDDGMYEFIQRNIESMHAFATGERATLDIEDDASMPYYSVEGDIIHPGPYYVNNVENEWYLADNISFELTELKPFVKYTRYIRNGVDVKPYTWFLLGYEYSKIPGKINPVWKIKNNTTDEDPQIFEGKRYLTLLLKKEGDYTVTLELDDKLGNKYTISRNIIVVSKSANYKLYQTVKKDYDFITEQEMINEIEYLDVMSSYSSSSTIIDDSSQEPYQNVYVYVYGNITIEPDIIDVDVDGEITLIQDEIPVNVDGVIIYTPETVDVNVNGIVTIVSDEVYVNVDGEVSIEPDVINVNVDGEITLIPEEVAVNVEGEITYIDDTPQYTYTVNIINGEQNSYAFVWGWFKDEQGFQSITEGVDGYTLTTSEESVWAIVVQCWGCKAEPSKINLTPEHSEGDITIFRYVYSIIIDNGFPAFVDLYADENYEQLITSGVSSDQLSCGESEVWVKVGLPGYKTEELHLYHPNNYTAHVTLVKNETNPEIVEVNVDGEITYEDDDNVEVSVLPMVQCGRKYPSGFDVSTETNTFPIVVSNDKNKPTTYTLNVDNYRPSNSFTKQATIDIGNGQSVFVIYKPGYSPSQSGSNTGTFNISCDDASNGITLQITSTNMTDHGPSIRCNNTSSVFSNVHLIPYSNENVSIDITLLGATQCARIDASTNTIYSYGDGTDMDDTPTESFTYKCYEGYRYLVYNNGKYVPTLVSYDTESMISDLQFNFDETNPRLYSHFNIDIAPNTENRLKFGVVYLGKDVSNPNNDDTGCIYLDSLIQESENIRFVLPKSERNSTYIINNLTYLNTTLETIDLSQHNKPYSFPSYSELFFMNNDVVNKITVTDMSNNEIQPTTMTSYGYPYKYGVSYILENNTGYIITIK